MKGSEDLPRPYANHGTLICLSSRELELGV